MERNISGLLDKLPERVNWGDLHLRIEFELHYVCLQYWIYDVYWNFDVAIEEQWSDLEEAIEKMLDTLTKEWRIHKCNIGLPLYKNNK